MSPALKTMFCLCCHFEKQLKIRRSKTEKEMSTGDNGSHREKRNGSKSQDNSPRFPHTYGNWLQLEASQSLQAQRQRTQDPRTQTNFLNDATESLVNLIFRRFILLVSASYFSSNTINGSPNTFSVFFAILSKAQQLLLSGY